ncbi:hypothetical protein [Candidatus Uabimicrobium sp. HlEnr_7]|uniref:hypothetical protein n=1 Tax=Candidatus Uabimicrobium helgolandensis TaxID=3095367 RepID=UPI003558C992
MDNRKKQRIISSFPFPIGYEYQVLAVAELKSRDDYLWLLLRSSDVLLKVVGTIALCDYLQNREELNDHEINRHILDVIEYNSAHAWQKMLTKFTNHVIANPNGYSVQEIKDLQTPTFEISSTLTTDNKPKHSWLEVMNLFVELDHELFVGKYQLSLPSKEILQSYSNLLEQVHFYCKFLEKYGVYVLVSKDERKTRGFLCCGTKSKPIGIRGISDEKWLDYKGRPFLSYKQKQNISLFPYIAPLVQQVETKKSFSDLLFFETVAQHSLTYFSYRHSRIVDYKECSSNALFLFQKDIRWLKNNTLPHAEQEKSQASEREFSEKWKTIYCEIFDFIASKESHYLYISSESGMGKTAMANFLQCHEQKLRDEFLLSTKTIVVYFFCEHENFYSYIDFLKEIYGQILKKVFTLTIEKTEERVSKLPHDSEAMLVHLFELMERANKEELSPYNKKLLIVCDGLFSVNEYVKYAIAPSVLPPNIFCLFFIKKDTKAHFLRFINTSKTPIYSLDRKVSFLLTAKEFYRYIDTYFPTFRDVHQRDLLYQKSSNNILYVKFCLEAYYKNYLQISSDLPQDISELFRLTWENLPSKHNFLAQKILVLASISQSYITDKMVAQIFSSNKDEIKRVKYSVNVFLNHKNYKYTISHEVYRNCILKLLSNYDKSKYHGMITNYYKQLLDQNLLSATKDSLLNIAYHYKESNNSDALFSLALNNEFRQEKLKRFKSYRLVLRDLQLALDLCYNNNDWQQLFKLSSEYSYVVHHSLKGVTHTFRYAEDGDYTSAVEMARSMSDATEAFSALLTILLFAIENDDYYEVDFVFEALEGIKDSSISYVSAGLEPFVIYVLQKISKTNILPIHTIIAKHGLVESNAVSHLFDIQSQVDFSENQLQIFISKVIQTSVQLHSADEKYEVIAEVVPVLYEINSLKESPEIWQLVTTLLDSISDTLIQTECCIIIAKTLSIEDSPRILQPYIEKFVNTIDQDIVLLAKYAQILNHMDDLESAKYQLEQAFIIISQQSQDQQYDSYLQVLPMICSIGDFDSMRIYWKRLFSASQKEISNDSHEKLISEVIIYFAQIQKWDHVLSLLAQLQLLKLDIRTNTFLHLSTHLKSVMDNSARQYWEVILEQTKSLKDDKKRLSILANCADGLFHLQILASDSIWKKYLTICDLLKDVGHDEDKNKALSYLACKMAENGYGKNAQTIISRLSLPKYRAKPLTKLALYKIKRGDFAEALKFTEDIADPYERYHIYLETLKKADNINFVVTTVTNDVQSENYSDVFLLEIVDELLNPQKIDTSKNIWHEVFSWMPHLNESDKITFIQKCIEKLSAVSYYEKTKLLWSYIFKSVAELENIIVQSDLYTNISITFVRWNQLQESIKYLDLALECCERMALDNRIYHLAKIASHFREMGEETRCNDILKIIDYEIWQNRSQIKDIYTYIVYLFNSSCSDLAQSLLEKSILVNVELHEESPEIDILTKIMDLCIDAKEHSAARGIFFQILPMLYKRGHDNLSNYDFLRLLPKMKKQVDVTELWKQAQSIVLNFSKVSFQQRYIEALSETVSLLDNYEDARDLWEKLLIDSRYVGKGVDVIRTMAMAGKQMLTIAPWESFAESFAYCVDLLSDLDSEYEKASALQHLTDTVLSASDFSVRSDIWQDFKRIPVSWKREDCKNNAYISLSKSLVENANTGIKRIFFSEAEQLANRVSKSQQICEIYLLLVDKYYECGMTQEANRTIEKTIDTGQSLGKFYQTTILPQIIQLYAKNANWENVWLEFKGITNSTLRTNLLFYFIDIIDEENKDSVLQKIIEIVEDNDIGNGDYFVAHVRTTKYLHDEKQILLFLEKATESWGSIKEDNDKKNVIDLISNFIAEVSISKEMWQKFINISLSIEQDAYRFLALQKIAFAILQTPYYTLIDDILEGVPVSDIKIQILERYVEKIYLQSPEKVFEMIRQENGDAQINIARKVVQKAGKAKDQQTLLRILVECPGSFSLNTLVVSEILKITLQRESQESFQSMLEATLDIWEIQF